MGFSQTTLPTSCLLSDYPSHTQSPWMWVRRWGLQRIETRTASRARARALSGHDFGEKHHAHLLIFSRIEAKASKASDGCGGNGAQTLEYQSKAVLRW